MKKQLYVDIDGTLANTMKIWLMVAEKDYHIKLKYEDLKDYDLHVITGLSYDVIASIFVKVWSENENIKLIDPAIPSILKALETQYDINIMTATLATDEQIIDWLERNNIRFKNLVHVKKSIDKAKIEGDLFIEDHLDVAEAIAAAGKKVILIAQPWNAGKIESGNSYITVAAGWKEVWQMLGSNPFESEKRGQKKILHV